MGYRTPPSMAVSNIPALIAGTLTGTMMASPGPGRAYRIYGYDFALNNNVLAGTLIYGVIRDSAASALDARISLGGSSTRAHGHMFPAPGILCPADTSIDYTVIASAAGGLFVATIYYYIDTIT